MSSDVPGRFALVLHSHLPWLAHHGRWPVGEEWLYQSWGAAYQPIFRVLRGLAADGYTDQLTLGVTPILAAQLDDPYCAAAMHEWLASWQLRAYEAALVGGVVGEAGRREYRAAADALTDFETHWRHGGSASIRALVDSGTVELLSGPLAHGFAPLMDPRLRMFALREGLADTHARIGSRSTGIWAPECAYTPGIESDYAFAGVEHFMVDGPSLRGDTALGRPVADSDVVAFGRDLDVSYRVWSPKSGYPGHSAYRDFHSFDHRFGLKLSRVTGRTVASDDKAPYDPQHASVAVARHVDDFVSRVRQRLRDQSERIGRDALVVAAFDTELFGHWWHEGPVWLDGVLRALPEAGITVTTLAGAQKDGFVGAPVTISESSWGSGKDWHVWNGDAVTDIVEINDDVTRLTFDTLDKITHRGRNTIADQILREAILTVASDWAFLVSKDTAAQYARDRVHLHAHATREMCNAVRDGDWLRADQLAAQWSAADGPFGGLDSRRLSKVGAA